MTPASGGGKMEICMGRLRSTSEFPGRLREMFIYLIIRERLDVFLFPTIKVVLKFHGTMATSGRDPWHIWQVHWSGPLGRHKDSHAISFQLLSSIKDLTEKKEYMNLQLHRAQLSLWAWSRLTWDAMSFPVEAKAFQREMRKFKRRKQKFLF